MTTQDDTVRTIYAFESEIDDLLEHWEGIYHIPEKELEKLWDLTEKWRIHSLRILCEMGGKHAYEPDHCGMKHHWFCMVCGKLFPKWRLTPRQHWVAIRHWWRRRQQTKNLRAKQREPQGETHAE